MKRQAVMEKKNKLGLD
ncbi:hypothetical protein AB3S75_032910 [Citrus x aurantiifolia]